MPDLAPLVAAAAVVAGAVALACTRQPRPSLAVLLDLLLAAGLLSLAGDPPPLALASAAGVVVVRVLVTASLDRAAPERAARPGGGGT